MGLDMYLVKRHYVKRWDRIPAEKQFDVTVKRGSEIYDAIKPERVSEVIEQVAYWRKANAVHAWFVKNVQDDKDDCQDYYVSREQLQELLGLAQEALTSKEPAKLLPTKAGFFFGNLEYNEDYRIDMSDTVRQLTEILAEPETDHASFYYRASW